MAKTKLSIQAVESLSKELGEPVWFADRRKTAFKTFEKLSAPSFKYGLQITLSPAGLDFNSIDIQKPNVSEIPKTPKGVTLVPFQKALDEFATELKKNYMTSLVTATEDKIIALHAAFQNSGYFFHIDEGVEIKEPLFIQSHSVHTQFDSVLVIAEPESAITLQENLTAPEGSHYKSQVVEVFAKENAHVTYASVQNLPQTTFSFATKRSSAGKNARTDWLDLTIGAKFAKSEVTTNLEGKGSSTDNKSMFLGKGEQQFLISTETKHLAPHTESTMLTRGAQKDTSKSIYWGMIDIVEKAIGSSGHQKSDTLLLNEGAIADAIPNLKTDTNDVSCSHGSTIGQIDKEKLFYLMSRGIPESEARQLVVQGFFQPFLSQIYNAGLQKKLWRILGAEIEA